MEDEVVTEALRTRIAQALLKSRIPARLAFNWLDGTPRVVPIWFHWNGTALVLGTGATSAKIRALQNNPNVCLTIDSEQPPYRSLQVRGRAEIEFVDGMVPEYELCAQRYYGGRAAEIWLARTRAVHARMARIVIVPERAQVLDVATLAPELARALEQSPTA